MWVSVLTSKGLWLASCLCPFCFICELKIRHQFPRTFAFPRLCIPYCTFSLCLIDYSFPILRLLSDPRSELVFCTVGIHPVGSSGRTWEIPGKERGHGSYIPCSLPAGLPGLALSPKSELSACLKKPSTFFSSSYTQFPGTTLLPGTDLWKKPFLIILSELCSMFCVGSRQIQFYKQHRQAHEMVKGVFHSPGY